MSFTPFRHPFDIARHPALEPEVKRAILASWASDAAAVEDQPALRRPDRSAPPIAFDAVMSALRSLDGDAFDEAVDGRGPSHDGG